MNKRKEETMTIKTFIKCQIVLFCIMVVVLFHFVSYIERTDVKEAVVIEVNNDEVVVVDRAGQEWAFYGDEYSVNERVKLIIDNNHTEDNLFDDEIINVKKTK